MFYLFCTMIHFLPRFIGLFTSHLSPCCPVTQRTHTYISENLFSWPKEHLFFSAEFVWHFICISNDVLVVVLMLLPRLLMLKPVSYWLATVTFPFILFLLTEAIIINYICVCFVVTSHFNIASFLLLLVLVFLNVPNFSGCKMDSLLCIICYSK